MPNSPPIHTSAAEVAIVLCTYNGADYLEEQVDSLLAQEHPIVIFASDDASSDDTVEQLSKRLRSNKDSLVTHAVNQGYVRNFEATLTRAVESGTGYVALSDQDDVWDKRRIGYGMRKMAELEKKHGLNVPLLVHSDLRLVDSQKQLLHGSFLAYRRYRITSQRNLGLVLGENGVMGNTILMNQAMANLCLPFPDQLHVHDYWIAVLAELFGYRAKLDHSLVDYRLHSENASNTANSMRQGYKAILANATWEKFLNRDFKLPFKEDSRLLTLTHLVDNADKFPELDGGDWKKLESFRHYLMFKQSRLLSYSYLLRSNMVRRGLLFRLKLFCIVMLTCRYPRK